jgi:NAD(P)-dependent dehydrogenase (short-subunit alcohol dehydrogenase family)
MPSLDGRVAIVAGATRGAGRGIARMLGAAGAVVYCTGRSTRDHPATGAHAGRPETVEETAALVDAAGGVGVAVRVDHAVEDEVAALVARVLRERGQVDLLVNVLGGPAAEDGPPFWEAPVAAGRALVDGWLWPHLITCRHVLPSMVARRAGLVVEVVESHTLAPLSPLYFDLAVAAIKRLSHALAEELAPHGVAALAIAPGFMRTEQVLAHFGTTEEEWRTTAETSPEARGYGLAGSETPCFVGRAVAALAADPAAHALSGGVHGSWELADRYGFTDVNGERPHWGRYFAANFPALAEAAPRTGRRWVVVGGAPA